MIKKMRYKFIAIMLAITAILLTTILVALYQTNKIHYEQQSLEVLREAARMENGRPESLRKDRSKNDLGHKSPSWNLLVVDQKKDGRVQIVINEIYGIENDEIEVLIAQVQEGGEKQGVLEEQNLRYILAEKGHSGTIRYVFADIYTELHSLHEQMKTFVVIWITSFTAFWLVSIWLSRWAVRPVEAAWKQQRQFVADASHELKTPLTVILSNANLLEQSSGDISESDRRRIAHIQAEAVHMNRLIESLLILAKQDTISSLSFDHGKVDFSYLVNYTVAVFESVMYEMEKVMDSSVEEAVYVNGNDKKLLQLVQILLDNAGKYSCENSKIEVCLGTCQNRKNGEAVLKVTSEGTPLTKEELSCVFHRFYRTDPSRSHVEGQGLGLSIAYEIVKEHNGQIYAESYPTGKNCFIVHLPLFAEES